MPISNADFCLDPSRAPASRSALFDSERPFLFEGLEPRYATKIVRSCFIPMRDGIKLSTDFHIPLGAKLPLPVVLVRTPYGKEFSRVAMPALLPEQGIVYAVQDVRGRYESEGEFVACSAADREDGYDTVSWLVAQSWCNGAVGTMGSSYTGETAAKLAAMRHPNHRCGVIMFDGSYSGGNSQNGAYLQGGVTMLRMMFGWFRDYVPKVSYGPPAHIDRESWFSKPYAKAYATQPMAQPPVDLDAQLRSLPVFDMLDRSGAAPSEFTDMMRRSANPADPYWHAQGFLTDADSFDTPTLHVSGPLERGGSSFDNFRLFRSNCVSQHARDHQYLWFTPAPHSGYYQCQENTTYGERSLGDTRFPYYRTLIDWFGHWLRGDALDLKTWPTVRYFLLNRNAWRTAENWPPTDVETRRLYLHSGGGANTRDGDGVLSVEPPTSKQPSDRFDYDPADPAPSEPPGAALDLLGGGYADRAGLELRRDTLIYTSPVLTEPLEVAGSISVELFVSSSAKDTDFAAVLTEVDPQGRSINVTHGIARMRYRDGVDKPALMTPGHVYPVRIDLWHAAVEFPAGHRIRLSIASSYFPAFDRNLNTGGDNFTETRWLTAQNSVYHDATHASALVLPVRPAPTA